MGDDNSENNTENVFPSTDLLVLLYCLGALVGLVLAINPSASSAQSTNCLLISWLLASIALGMSITTDESRVQLPHDEDFY